MSLNFGELRHTEILQPDPMPPMLIFVAVALAAAAVPVPDMVIAIVDEAAPRAA